ncbi:MAG: helix-turn-helix domain-containing protein [Bacteroidaceae bacterium]|jgi:transcriptional regulator with XRE-family HTH domain|nr:helix-turn-helix domain-containing protein [Bacteroidaceae bacterium]
MKDRIYQLMKYQGMSQKEFAATLCIAEGTLSGIFTGRTRPTNNIVNAIHECFPHISINWLMFGEGEMLLEDAASHAPETAAGQSDLFSSATPPSFEPNSTPSPAPQIQEVVKYVDKPQRKITEIRVFYDDGTFETFSS